MNNIAILQAGTDLLGRIINSRGEPLDEKGPITSRSIQKEMDDTALLLHTPGIYETGIKAIDLLAPIPRSGLAGIYSGMGVGTMTLLEEMINTFAQRLQGYTLYLSMYEQHYTTTPFYEIMRDSDLHTQIICMFEPWQEHAHILATQMLQASYTILEHLRRQGHTVLCIIEAALANACETADIETLQQFSRDNGVLSIVLRGMTEDVTQEPDQFDSTIVMSNQMAKLGLWPAIDRLQSSSQLFKGEMLGTEHKEIAHKVREILQLSQIYHEQPALQITHEQRQIIQRAQRINFFLTQPFTIAEPYAGIPGEYLTLAQTIASFTAIMAGDVDDLPLQAFRFIGPIEQAGIRSRYRF